MNYLPKVGTANRLGSLPGYVKRQTSTLHRTQQPFTYQDNRLAKMFFSSASVALGLATSVTARYLPRNPEEPTVHASDLITRQESIPTIEQSADGSVPAFAYEESTLSGTSASGLSKFGELDVTASNTATVDYTLTGTDNCKVFPGDAQWPSDEDWEALDSATTSPLLKPLPQAHICYSNGTGIAVDNATCQAVTDSWTDPFFQ